MFDIAKRDINFPIKSLWDEFWSGEDFFAPFFARVKNVWNPSVEMEETDKEYIIKFDLPGVKKEEISIEAKNDTLTVSGERKAEKKENTKHRRYNERFYGTFTRTFRLPESVKTEEITASYKDGVLEIKVPKQEEAKVKKIAIS